LLESRKERKNSSDVLVRKKIFSIGTGTSMDGQSQCLSYDGPRETKKKEEKAQIQEGIKREWTEKREDKRCEYRKTCCRGEHQRRERGKGQIDGGQGEKKVLKSSTGGPEKGRTVCFRPVEEGERDY